MSSSLAVPIVRLSQISQIKNEFKNGRNLISRRSNFCKRRCAFVSGLSNIKVGELVKFLNKSNNIFGMALNLEADQVGVIVLGDDQGITQNDSVLH